MIQALKTVGAVAEALRDNVIVKLHLKQGTYSVIAVEQNQLICEHVNAYGEVYATQFNARYFAECGKVLAFVK